jgi:hypothetical protein
MPPACLMLGSCCCISCVLIGYAALVAVLVALLRDSPDSPALPAPMCWSDRIKARFRILCQALLTFMLKFALMNSWMRTKSLTPLAEQTK